MSETNRQLKQELVDRLQVELDNVRRREAFLANYILDLTCEIRQIEFEEMEDRGELPYQRSNER